MSIEIFRRGECEEFLKAAWWKIGAMYSGYSRCRVRAQVGVEIAAEEVGEKGQCYRLRSDKTTGLTISVWTVGDSINRGLETGLQLRRLRHSSGYRRDGRTIVPCRLALRFERL